MELLWDFDKCDKMRVLWVVIQLCLFSIPDIFSKMKRNEILLAYIYLRGTNSISYLKEGIN